MAASNGIQAEPAFTTSYYPSHFVYGLLSEHCGSETGRYAGRSEVKVNDRIKFNPENGVYQAFQARGVDIMEHLSSWIVLEVIDDKSTGYLGLIYYNKPQNQIVLAHRSTNFALSFTTINAIVGGSGAQTDVEAVLMNKIVSHQAYGYFATSIAIDLSKTHNTSLSFTGHSLGAWLAELSVFYCNTTLNYDNVKAVIFDGPGAAEMIDLLGISNIRQGQRSTFKAKNLDIVEYLSAPSIVNCINSHAGCVYRIFPDIPNSAPNKLLKKFVDPNTLDALLATFGHDLKHILVNFDPLTGKVKRFTRVEGWPSIKYKAGNGNSELFFTIVTDVVKNNSLKTGLGDAAVKLLTSELLRERGMTTIGSFVTLTRAFFSGKIEHEQFWLAHKYLDKNNGYRCEMEMPNVLAEFSVTFEANYETRDADPRKIITTRLDKYLKRLKKYSSKMVMNVDVNEEVKQLVGKFDLYLSDVEYICLTNRAITQGFNHLTT